MYGEWSRELEVKEGEGQIGGSDAKDFRWRLVRRENES